MAKVQTLNMQTGEKTESDDGRKETTHTIEESLFQLRSVRDGLLAQSDWVVIKEREEGGAVSNFADWKEYRQKLRDITSGIDSIAKIEEKLKQDKDGKFVNFPTKPSE